MGSFTPRGKPVRRFRAEDDDGSVYSLLQYDRIIGSREVRADGMSTAGRLQRQFTLKDGSAVEELEAKTYKIVSANKIIREI